MATKAAASYRMSASALAQLFQSAVGEEKAAEVVTAVLGELRISAAAGLAQGEALKALELVAKSPGILGITARFAMSHVHLHWGEERPARPRPSA